VTVEGTVTFQDKPIESGTLTFFAAQGAPVTAVINGGSYSCQLEPGEYRAVVAVGVTLPPGYKEGDPIPPQAMTLPDKYSSRLNTPLTASVSADQAVGINFELN
jgi:hypothetical protein